MPFFKAASDGMAKQRTIRLPQAPKPFPATSEAELERTVQALKAKAPTWVATPAARRAELLRACLPCLMDMLPEAVDVGVKTKGAYEAGTGEEYLFWLPVGVALRELAEALEAGGQPPVVSKHQRPDGQWVVEVMPKGLLRLANSGFKGSLWIKPGQEPTQGELYRHKAAGEGDVGPGRVALVLGAGNQVSVAALDILHKLVFDDEVVVCKMNPVNENMGPYIARAFAPLVDAGFLAIVYGGGDVGKFLCGHPDVGSIHLTGSAATYDAIVWQGQPKVGKPPCQKEVGAELGCLTPYIIVPGKWSASDLDSKADIIAAALTMNAGHNCLKAEVVIVDAAWPQRGAFLDALRKRLATVQRRAPYYPASESKYKAFRAQFGDRVEELGEQGSVAEPSPDYPVQPWLLATGLTPDTADLVHENWCGVLQEVALPAAPGGVDGFLDRAVAFANERVWGSLSAGLIIHPATRAAHAAAYDRAVARLRYGAVTVNCPTTMAYANTAMAWGAFPGNDATDIGSGNCFVHNTSMLDHVQKGVVEGPWVVRPRPNWATDNPTIQGMAPAAAWFYAYPTWTNFACVVWRMLWG